MGSAFFHEDGKLYRSKKHIFALRCFCSAGKLIVALHCSFRLSFFLTPNIIPCCSLPRSLFLFKPISQAGLAGSEHNVLAQEKDNTDRKRRAQPPRWTGSWVHCLVSLIRWRRKRQRRGDMVRQTRRAKLRLRRRNWLSVYIYIYLNPNRKKVERTSSYCLTVYQKAFQAGLSFKGTSSTPIPGAE